MPSVSRRKKSTTLTATCAVGASAASERRSRREWTRRGATARNIGDSMLPGRKVVRGIVYRGRVSWLAEARMSGGDTPITSAFMSCLPRNLPRCVLSVCPWRPRNVCCWVGTVRALASGCWAHDNVASGHLLGCFRLCLVAALPSLCLFLYVSVFSSSLSFPL